MKGKDIFIGLVLAVLISAVLVPFASQMPDGLEKVAAEQGFAAKESDNPAVAAPFADYRIPGIASKNLSAAASGIIGVLAVFCTVRGIAVLLKRRKIR
jgi:hypothetical protein